jgi:hypothetical protein
MPRTLLLALLFAVALGGAAAPNPTAVNLDFESGSPGEVPTGVALADGEGSGTRPRSRPTTPKQGKQCVHLSSGPSTRAGAAGVRQRHAADRRHAVPRKTRPVPRRRSRRRRGPPPPASGCASTGPPNRWASSRTCRPVPSRRADGRTTRSPATSPVDAEVLNFGLILEQEGSTWLDDVTIQTVAPVVMRSGPARAVTPRGLENLVAFTRLFGIVRHFHASDEAAAADWDAVAVNGAAAVESAQNPSELASRLREIFVPLAPSIRIYRQMHRRGRPPRNRPGRGHRGVAAHRPGIEAAAPGRHLCERACPPRHRQRRPQAPGSAAAPPTRPRRRRLRIIPLAVYADASHTLPRPPREARSPFDRRVHRERSCHADRRGGDRSGTPSSTSSPTSTSSTSTGRRSCAPRCARRAPIATRLHFAGTLQRMIAALDDGHGSVLSPIAEGDARFLPILWRVMATHWSSPRSTRRSRD